jgi:hypothetical protein
MFMAKRRVLMASWRSEGAHGDATGAHREATGAHGDATGAHGDASGVMSMTRDDAADSRQPSARRVFVAFGVGKIINLNRGSEPASVTACGSPAPSQRHSSS